MLNPIIMITTHNQANSVVPLIEATKGFKRLWAVDRSTDDTINMLDVLGESYVENKTGEGFLAGKTRDIGLDYILDKDYDTVIMLDGDRVPTGLTMELVEQEMAKSDCSLGYCEKDMRLDFSITQGKPYIWMNLATAGIIVKTEFLKKIRKLSFMDNRCFHKDFDGWYGEEDTFLGHCLYNVGANVIKSKMVLKGSIPSNTYYKNSENVEIKLKLLTNFRRIHAHEYR